MRDTATIIHRKTEGSPDYMIVLTFEFGQESGQWVGLCLELGTSTFADTFDNIRLELQDAVELQLNEVERLGHIQDYLAENHVRVVPVDAVNATSGFTVVGETR
jgi:hypothetical protein